MPSCLLQCKSIVEIISCTPEVFACGYFLHILGPKRDKLNSKVVKHIFLGYSSRHQGFKCEDPIDEVRYVSMDVTFFESIPHFSSIGYERSLQGENQIHFSEESKFMVPLLAPTPLLSKEDGIHRKKELKMYIRSEKMAQPEILND
ncbi:hypothetical protein AMTR_s00058p00207240 [Amborella trichopoda]|uniref:Retroviral polymerase SH3-like domain-containing protein n=1 Tax=Amborella trichopoda TaxID=13333 RepID=W1PGF1_AMBTC|nr:hypothetical protein AMTR_s00058p00207240 [Amborella trichopoda]